MSNDSTNKDNEHVDDLPPQDPATIEDTDASNVKGGGDSLTLDRNIAANSLLGATLPGRAIGRAIGGDVGRAIGGDVGRAIG